MARRGYARINKNKAIIRMPRPCRKIPNLKLWEQKAIETKRTDQYLPLFRPSMDSPDVVDYSKPRRRRSRKTPEKKNGGYIAYIVAENVVVTFD